MKKPRRDKNWAAKKVRAQAKTKTKVKAGKVQMQDFGVVKGSNIGGTGEEGI